MASRIKYSKDREGRLVSIRAFMSTRTGARYKVRLTPEEQRLQVINLGNRNIVKDITIKGKTLLQLKKRVKSELKKLGVPFDIEIREQSDD